MCMCVGGVVNGGNEKSSTKVQPLQIQSSVSTQRQREFTSREEVNGEVGSSKVHWF